MASIPDVTALAKSLGGGKAAVGAMIASRSVYMKAYGTPKTAMIHAQATFGGIGEACITAIEGLNVLYDEGLIDNAAVTGDYLIERLKAVQAKYPNIVKDVRGKGFMVGLEFHDFSQTLPMVLRPIVGMLDDKLKGSLSGFVGSLLLRDYGVLVAFTEYNRNVIRLEPPLICQREHVDQFVDALDELAGARHRVDRQGFREKPGRAMADATMLSRAPTQANAVERLADGVLSVGSGFYARFAVRDRGDRVFALHPADGAVAVILPDANWDMLPYLAVAEESAYPTPQALHDYAYGTVKAAVSRGRLPGADRRWRRLPHAHGERCGGIPFDAADVSREIPLCRGAVRSQPGDAAGHGDAGGAGVLGAAVRRHHAVVAALGRARWRLRRLSPQC